jgi:hypothetical protein
VLTNYKYNAKWYCNQIAIYNRLKIIKALCKHFIPLSHRIVGSLHTDCLKWSNRSMLKNMQYYSEKIILNSINHSNEHRFKLLIDVSIYDEANTIWYIQQLYYNENYYDVRKKHKYVKLYLKKHIEKHTSSVILIYIQVFLSLYSKLLDIDFIKKLITHTKYKEEEYDQLYFDIQLIKKYNIMNIFYLRIKLDDNRCFDYKKQMILNMIKGKQYYDECQIISINDHFANL